jgi:acetyltransferase-like isoleucine patch superfamily enzyme
MIGIKYYLQKLLGWFLSEPMIPQGRTCGFSLVRSEFVNSSLGKSARAYPPFSLHNVSLGDYTYIAKNSNVSNCTIGKFCSIGPNFCCGLGIHPTKGISTSPMFFSKAKQNGLTLCEEEKVDEFALSLIGNDVFIGANVTILDGVAIGDGAIIGAGAVVTKDIPPYAIAVGVPASVKHYRFDTATIEKLLRRKWWEGDERELEAVARHWADVDSFLSETTPF